MEVNMKETSSQNRDLKVFLCHSSSDKSFVRNLYVRLRRDGVLPWLDEKNILAGQDWEMEIKLAVQNSHAIIVCLSSLSVVKEGYVQKEIKFALDVADEKPERTIYIIPLKLDGCVVPYRLRQWQWIEYSQDDWYERLIQALQIRAKTLNLNIPMGNNSLDVLRKSKNLDPREETFISHAFSALEANLAKTYTRASIKFNPSKSRKKVSEIIEETPEEKIDITFYQKYLSNLYSDQPIENSLWLLTKAALLLCKAISDGNNNPHFFVRVVTWLLVFSSRSTIPLQEAYIANYPGVCPTCLEARCICIETNKKPSTDFPKYYYGERDEVADELFFKSEGVKYAVSIFNFDYAIKNHTKIFSVNKAIYEVSGVQFFINKIPSGISDMFEAYKSFEAGMVPNGEVYRKASEFFGWVVFLWDMTFKSKSLDESIKNFYSQECPECGTFPCKCNFDI